MPTNITVRCDRCGREFESGDEQLRLASTYMDNDGHGLDITVKLCSMACVVRWLEIVPWSDIRLQRFQRGSG